MLGYEVFIVGAIFYKVVRDAVSDGQVALWLHVEEMVSKFSGTSATGSNIDESYLFSA